jgi:putative DNA primase/helicase
MKEWPGLLEDFAASPPADISATDDPSAPSEVQPLLERITALAKSDAAAAAALALSPECLTVLAKLKSIPESAARNALKAACTSINSHDLRRAVKETRFAQARARVRTPAEERKEEGRQIFNPEDPLEQARTFILSRFCHEGIPTLQHFQVAWLEWNGMRWIERASEYLRSEAYNFLDASLVINADTNETHAFDPGKKDVDAFMDALRAVQHCRAEFMLSWYNVDARSDYPKARDVIAFNNGLLDVRQWLADQSVSLLRHTPRWFSAIALPFNYDPDATCPQWDAFLSDIWDSDTERVLAFSMWCGYLLTQDTSQHRLAILVGPARAGKGTCLRIIESLLGKENVVSPGLTSLATEFGLQPLLGKLAAMIADAHLGHGSDAVAVLERLKTISGEDSITINRKNATQVTVRLSVRFTIACNELVALPDPSGALAGRAIVFPFQKSFAGREDRDLEKRLLGELPGILNWALRGLRALRERGQLLQPAAGEQTRLDMRRLSSPVIGFLEDYCTYPAPGSVSCSMVYDAWKLHAERNGHHAGSREAFGQRLLGAAPGVSRKKVGPRGQQVGHYVCLALTEATLREMRRELHPEAVGATRSEAV